MSTKTEERQGIDWKQRTKDLKLLALAEKRFNAALARLKVPVEVITVIKSDMSDPLIQKLDVGVRFRHTLADGQG